MIGKSFCTKCRRRGGHRRGGRRCGVRRCGGRRRVGRNQSVLFANERLLDRAWFILHPTLVSEHPTILHARTTVWLTRPPATVGLFIHMQIIEH